MVRHGSGGTLQRALPEEDLGEMPLTCHFALDLLYRTLRWARHRPQCSRVGMAPRNAEARLYFALRAEWELVRSGKMESQRYGFGACKTGQIRRDRRKRLLLCSDRRMNETDLRCGQERREWRREKGDTCDCPPSRFQNFQFVGRRIVYAAFLSPDYMHREVISRLWGEIRRDRRRICASNARTVA